MIRSGHAWGLPSVSVGCSLGISMLGFHWGGNVQKSINDVQLSEFSHVHATRNTASTPEVPGVPFCPCLSNSHPDIILIPHTLGSANFCIYVNGNTLRIFLGVQLPLVNITFVRSIHVLACDAVNSFSSPYRFLLWMIILYLFWHWWTIG